MQVTPVSAFNDNYIWMIINENEQEASCVDPGDAKPVLKFLKNAGLRLKTILLTHHHYDHMDGAAELLRVYPEIPVYGPQDSRLPMVTKTVQDGDVLSLEPYEFKIIATPGHTSTHISYYEPHHHLLFCGDTLFSGGCGRVFDGTIEELKDSLDKLKKLPEETQVFCAHEYTQRNLRFAATVEPDNLAIRNYAHRLLAKEKRCSLPSSIAVEKQVNPFLRTDTAAVQSYAREKGCKDIDPLSVFKLIRAAKDVF